MISGKNIVITILLFIMFIPVILPQDSVFIPLNIQNAYKKKTRSSDGKPGENYWQNSSDYLIEVEVFPSQFLLKGKETIKYQNNSPDSLTQIVLRLYQNYNQVGAARNFEMNPDAVTDGVVLDKIILRDKEINLFNNSVVKVQGTNLFIYPDKPVAPESNIELKISWHLSVPKAPNYRMGAYDSAAFMIAYWYPQIAVYDDIDDWDVFDYNVEQEFYNDFSNFDVKITVPNNFAVWSTGVLQNAESLLNGKYLALYNEANSSEEIIHIITEKNLKEGNIFNSENQKNTWHFKAENVNDVAFALSRKHLWHASSLALDNEENPKVFISAAYLPESKDFYDVVDISRESIKYFSEELPGVTFPFPSITVFNGSGGMEFPMMINDGSTSEYHSTFGLTSHEIAHSYFPFYVGTNERKYAHMDEGIARFLPLDLIEELSGFDRLAVSVKRYEKLAGEEMEMPPITPSMLLRRESYRVASYDRPGVAYYYLSKFLGKEKFCKAFKEYINRWKGKHPLPYDFFNTFNDVLGEDLNWYFKPWFFEKGYPDLSIENVSYENNRIDIKIGKKGNIPVPVEIVIWGTDNNKNKIFRSADIWKEGKNHIEISEEIKVKPGFVILGSDRIPDVNGEDNIFYFNKN